MTDEPFYSAARTAGRVLCGRRYGSTWSAVRLRVMASCRVHALPALALVLLLSACAPRPLPVPTPAATATLTPPAADARLFQPTRTRIPDPPPPTSTVPMNDLVALVESKLPRLRAVGLLKPPRAVPLVVPPGRQPLWVVYAWVFGTEDQLVAVYTREGGRWRELAWRTFGFSAMALPPYPEVTTVQVTVDRAWFVIDGLFGNHGSSWSLFSFDGRRLALQISLTNDVYNLGQIRTSTAMAYPMWSLMCPTTSFTAAVVISGRSVCRRGRGIRQPNAWFRNNSPRRRPRPPWTLRPS